MHKTRSVDVDEGKKAEEQPGYLARLQATLNVLPAHTWYAAPSGGLTFVNKRTADYLGLPKDHPLRFGIDVGAQWDAHLPFVHPDDRAETQENWSTRLRTGEGGEGSFFAGLPDDGIAADESECGVPAPDGDGEVEGRDDANDAEWVPGLHHAVVGAFGRDGAAV